MAKRIWTQRHGPEHVEMLELHDNGVVFWREETPFDVSQFFVDEEFIREKFAETGRAFDRTKLPANFVSHPRNG
jgi:hypothetical protein